MEAVCLSCQSSEQPQNSGLCLFSQIVLVISMKPAAAGLLDGTAAAMAPPGARGAARLTDGVSARLSPEMKSGFRRHASHNIFDLKSHNFPQLCEAQRNASLVWRPEQPGAERDSRERRLGAFW